MTDRIGVEVEIAVYEVIQHISFITKGDQSRFDCSIEDKVICMKDDDEVYVQGEGDTYYLTDSSCNFIEANESIFKKLTH